MSSYCLSSVTFLNAAGWWAAEVVALRFVICCLRNQPSLPMTEGLPVMVTIIMRTQTTETTAYKTSVTTLTTKLVPVVLLPAV